jgi:L-ascorbate metabolism protein UlaG (beta-lactamase superfamily)
MKTMLIALAALGPFAVVACNPSSSPPPAAPDGTSPAASAPSADPTAAPSASGDAGGSGAAGAAASDTFATSAGPLVVTPIHHASLRFDFAGKHIFVDPWTEGNLEGQPKADYIFVTDIHPDHLDQAAIDKLKTPTTIVVGPAAVGEKTALGVTLKNGESKDFGAFKAEAVPMYNLTRGPAAGKLFHDKGRGDGFVFTFGDKRVYDSGDTECTPEMKALKNIDVAFVCMNLPYTMPPSEAAECVKAFKPKVVYPFHFRGQDPSTFATMVKDAPVEVRIRTWY